MINNENNLYLRQAELSDVDILFEWANDALTRKNSFNEAAIKYDEHVVWFNKLLEDENKYQLILMDGENPVGQIRLTVLNDTAEIGYSVAPIYRGYGYGKRILAMTLVYVQSNLPGVKKLVGQVKPSNVASYKAFIDNGFEEKYRFLEIDVAEWSKQDSSVYSISDDIKSGGVLFLTNNANTLGLFEWICRRCDADIYSDKLTRSVIDYYKPRLIVSYNYSNIVKADVIDYAENIINMHISYLPWNRGSNPNFWSFVENTPKGVTIHKMAAGLDTGDIVCQKELFFDENVETLETTYNTLQREIVELFKEHWNELFNGTYDVIPQVGIGTYHTSKDYEKYREKVNYNVCVRDMII